MKTIYIIIIFLAIFQMTVILVNATDIFPKDGTLYGDLDYNKLTSQDKDAFKIFETLFTPSDRTIAGISLGKGIWQVVLIIGTIGTGIALFTRQYTVAVLAVIALMFIPLVSNSLGFFNTLIHTWNHESISYLAVIFAVSMLIIIFITILETPTHGRS